MNGLMWPCFAFMAGLYGAAVALLRRALPSGQAAPLPSAEDVARATDTPRPPGDDTREFLALVSKTQAAIAAQPVRPTLAALKTVVSHGYGGEAKRLVRELETILESQRHELDGLRVISRSDIAVQYRGKRSLSLMQPRPRRPARHHLEAPVSYDCPPQKFRRRLPPRKKHGGRPDHEIEGDLIQALVDHDVLRERGRLGGASEQLVQERVWALARELMGWPEE